MKQHTIIFVPHARAKFRKWRLTSLQAWTVIGTLGALTLGGLVAMVALLNTSVDRQQLDELQAENATLREINLGFESSIRNLEGQVEDYQQRIHKLAIVAGISDLAPGGDAGIGGTSPIVLDGEVAVLQEDADLYRDMLDIQSRLETMGAGMNLLQQKLEEDQLLIASTPSIAPVKGLFTSSYGYRSDPFTAKRTFHQGIDIVAPRGKEIYATGDGLVIKAETMRGLGRAVYISHGFGITTRYGHMTKILVEAGQRVERGDVIGTVGSTGRSTGNHVHYEVHVDGKPTNPLPYILDGIAP